MKNLQVYFLSIVLAHISKSHIVCIYIFFKEYFQYSGALFNHCLGFFHLFQSENTQQENYIFLSL